MGQFETTVGEAVHLLFAVMLASLVSSDFKASSQLEPTFHCGQHVDGRWEGSERAAMGRGKKLFDNEEEAENHEIRHRRPHYASSHCSDVVEFF